MNLHTLNILTFRRWLSIVIPLFALLAAGCTNDYYETDYVFEPAEHYDLVDVHESLQLLWTFTTDERIMNPVIIDDDRVVYIQTQEAVYAVDPQNGSLIWRHQIKNPLQTFVVPFGDILLIPTEREQVLQGVDSVTGKTIWELPFYNHVSAYSGRPRMTDIVVDDQRAYILLALNRGTAVLAIDPLTGGLLWEAPDDLREGLSGKIFQDNEEDFLHIRGGGGIWKLDKDDGHILGRIDTPLKSSRQPTYADGVAYTSGGPARAVDLETGETVWSFSPKMCTNSQERTVFEPPILDNDVGYLLTACEYIAQVELKSGEPRWLIGIRPTVQSFEPTEDAGYAFTPFGDLLEVDKTNGEAHIRLSLSPPEIDVTTYDHLTSDEDLLILTPGNNQAFAFRLE